MFFFCSFIWDIDGMEAGLTCFFPPHSGGVPMNAVTPSLLGEPLAHGIAPQAVHY